MRSKKDIPVEEKSYAPLFFILSGLLGLVTIWGFWNETVTRRPWKAIQKNFYQYEYEKAKIELEKAKRDLGFEYQYNLRDGLQRLIDWRKENL